MASIKQNLDKNGKVLSYRFRACIGRDSMGKQQWVTKTVTPPSGLTPKKEIKEMQRQADEWEVALRQGTTPVKDENFNAFIEKIFWPLHVENGNHKASTIAFYNNMKPRCLEFFGKKKLASIKKVDVEKFMLWLREVKTKNGQPLSAGTLKHYYNFMRIVFTFAEDHDLIARSPMKGIVAPKQPHNEVSYLTSQQATLFLEKLNTAPLRWQTIIQMLIYLGLRRGEVCALQWHDINFAQGTVSIQRNVVYTSSQGIQVGEPKTKNSFRTLPIPQPVMQRLKEWKEEQAKSFAPSVLLPSAFVFSSELDPYTPQFPTHITKKVKQLMAAYGLPDFSPHDLRHTCGSLMLDNGANLKAVQQFLGHEDPETTLKFYAGTNSDSLKKAGNTLELVLQKGTENIAAQ